MEDVHTVGLLSFTRSWDIPWLLISSQASDVLTDVVHGDVLAVGLLARGAGVFGVVLGLGALDPSADLVEQFLVGDCFEVNDVHRGGESHRRGDTGQHFLAIGSERFG
ncbi:hypothetical protein ACFFX0_25925 [Citricoccus parietis]|uniref:Uncharacterized protein n=1 Tax=Citricoccus parietis TaxID=592307 RepID=A0ABV5G670_9MICC